MPLDKSMAMNSAARTIPAGPLVDDLNITTMPPDLSTLSVEISEAPEIAPFNLGGDDDFQAHRPSTISTDSFPQSSGGTTLVGNDSRIPVPHPNKYPYSAVVAIWVDVGRGPFLQGSGVLISPNLVLTAGHNLYNFLDTFGTKAFCAYVYFGLNGDLENSIRIRVPSQNFITITEWMHKKDSRFDYAGLILPTPYGRQVGWMTPSSFADGELRRFRVTNVSYPMDCPAAAGGFCSAPGSTMWYDNGMILKPTTHTLEHTLDTAFGSSGSPVISYLPNSTSKYRVVGIHTRGLLDPSRNLAIRVSRTVVSDVKHWASAYAGIPI